MEKIIKRIAIFTSIDQIIKIIITQFFLDANIVLIPNILWLKPVQNTNLSWVAALSDHQGEVWEMLIFQIISVVLIVFIFRYLLYIYSLVKLDTNLVRLYFPIVMSGILCSFIDTVVWGGSWDYLKIFNWVTFDLKDLYLITINLLLLSIIMIRYMKVYNKTSETERIDDGVLNWLKEGAPTKSKNN